MKLSPPWTATNPPNSNTVGLLRAGEAEAAVGEEINLGTGREISIGELARCLAAMVGPDVTISHDAERVRPAESEVMRLVADNTRARRLLGWEPRVSLDEGLRRTMAWIVEHPAQYAPDSYRV